MTSPLVELHSTLDRRYRPEDVAELVLRVLDPSLEPRERAVIERAARHSHGRRGYASSMGDDFARPVGGSRQLAATARLFEEPSFAAAAADSPSALAAVASAAGERIGWAHDRHDFKADRLSRAERAAAGMDVSKRQYNRRFRALGRLAAKADKLADEQDLRRLLLIGRSGFASTITLERFRADPAAACFVAYFAARRNLRREFSLDGRDNPFDEIAQLLLARCEANQGTDWPMVASVYGRPSILARLTDAQRGEMLGQWTSVMHECGQRLERIWTSTPFDRKSMIVKRGDDSSTWNTVAQAYNGARAGWLACLTSMGALDLLDAACPGKVMRLMAADLAWWHQASGGGLDPNTRVWASLPSPWDVLTGRAVSTRADVEQACAAANLNPHESGWTAAPATHQVATFEPTPELVHGVTVADPVWASLLRRAGVFSGRAGGARRGE
ncbi:hypothetical protein GT755_07790 [Herbidospora sp. NEAU-GS84]|uniref:Uncharacterized protein n=1 Tax=Herbidospora solisilvae TaxID=2696284 RepID=A0A7C9JAN9_9ACTN|nr:hypothetical protein [Herbidospora solisilvae]NAS21584.1 hypothetical protein [Herbidospora solisilvae]